MLNKARKPNLRGATLGEGLVPCLVPVPIAEGQTLVTGNEPHDVRLLGRTSGKILPDPPLTKGRSAHCIRQRQPSAPQEEDETKKAQSIGWAIRKRNLVGVPGFEPGASTYCTWHCSSTTPTCSHGRHRRKNHLHLRKGQHRLAGWRSQGYWNSDGGPNEQPSRECSFLYEMQALDTRRAKALLQTILRSASVTKDGTIELAFP